MCEKRKRKPDDDEQQQRQLDIKTLIAAAHLIARTRSRAARLHMVYRLASASSTGCTSTTLQQTTDLCRWGTAA